ncbi:MAG: hypothetical protein Terrestrivirus3_137 [Terrestrivirus sp.]|uniref:Uncharacterized protein n=1 Tax=Terrestrivirus sp. TaxID=2487775 RepID=A0A3G4ZM05_9VIRU|nr:MAG: hypothetical protein Terrestrivirus3_137 [Terrestrivirus sp.]
MWYLWGSHIGRICGRPHEHYRYIPQYVSRDRHPYIANTIDACDSLVPIALGLGVIGIGAGSGYLLKLAIDKEHEINEIIKKEAEKLDEQVSGEVSEVLQKMKIGDDIVIRIKNMPIMVVNIHDTQKYKFGSNNMQNSRGYSFVNPESKQKNILVCNKAKFDFNFGLRPIKMSQSDNSIEIIPSNDCKFISGRAETGSSSMMKGDQLIDSFKETKTAKFFSDNKVVLANQYYVETLEFEKEPKYIKVTKRNNSLYTYDVCGVSKSDVVKRRSKYINLEVTNNIVSGIAVLGLVSSVAYVVYKIFS